MVRGWPHLGGWAVRCRGRRGRAGRGRVGAAAAPGWGVRVRGAAAARRAGVALASGGTSSAAVAPGQ
eukprot:scaffold106444_cov21-Phaeocystis_antarctica.AAC.1